MKKLFLVVLISLFLLSMYSFSYSQGIWTEQTSGTTNNLLGVSFTDPTNGWAVGASQTIIHTADGGQTWSTQTFNSHGMTISVNGVCFRDTLNGWAVGGDAGGGMGFLLRTTNGGTTWSDVLIGSTLYGVFFTDLNNGYAVGRDCRIARTTNGGANWSDQTIDYYSMVNLYGVCFADSVKGWAVGASGKIYHTTDGTNWSAQTSGTGNALRGVCFTDSSNGWAVGDNGTILQTTDGGTAWSAQTSGTSERLRGVNFANPNCGWITGDNGKILYTTDGGQNWSTQESITGEHLLGVSFTNSENGWAVGANGTILNYKGPWTEQTSGTTNNLLGVSFSDPMNGWAVGASQTIIHTADGGQTWSTQTFNSHGMTISVNGVCFRNTLNGWAVGGDAGGGMGFLLRTTNGGTTWSDVLIGSTLYGVFFTDLNNGYAVGRDCRVARTTNGGANWSDQTIDWYSMVNLYGVCFADPITGWAVGASGKIYHTTNGTNWSEQTSGTGNTLMGVYFTDSSNGWAVGYNGTILHTTDGGTTWGTQTSGTSEHLRGLDFPFPNYGLIVGDNGTILRTGDGGQNWIISGGFTDENLSGVSLPDRINGWAVGTNGTILNYTPFIPRDSLEVMIPETVFSGSGATPGDTVTVPVLVDKIFYDHNNGIYSLQTEILYDDSLFEYIGHDTIGTVLSNYGGLNGFMVNSKAYISSEPGVPDTIRIACASDDSLYYQEVPGTPFAFPRTLINLMFRIPPATSSNTSMALHFDRFMFNEGIPGVFTVDGTIETQLPYLGDVDQDGQIIPYDAVLVLRHVIHDIILSSEGQMAADVSGNGEITAYDASLILQIFVGKYTPEPPFYKRALPSNRNAEIALEIGGVENGYVNVAVNAKGLEEVYGYSLVLSYDKNVLAYQDYQLIQWTEGLIGRVYSEDNKLRIAAAGINPLAGDGEMVTLRFKVKGNSMEGSSVYLNEAMLNEELVISGENIGASIPKTFSLGQNYPNPFNPDTRINYQLPEATHVSIVIYNLVGQVVRTLVNADKPAGTFEVIWDNKNDEGIHLSSGVYIYRMRAGSFSMTRKMIFMK